MDDVIHDELISALPEVQREKVEWMRAQGCTLSLSRLEPVPYLRKTNLYRLEVQLPGGIVIARRDGPHLETIVEEAYRDTRARLSSWSNAQPNPDVPEVRSVRIPHSRRPARWYARSATQK